MSLHQYRLLALGLGPIALGACTEPYPATVPAAAAAPTVGIDLGGSSRIPRIAGLAGAGEGFGRTEPEPMPTSRGSRPGSTQRSGAGMPIEHGSMAEMSHGSITGTAMAHDSIPSMNSGSTSAMPMEHGAMSGMAHSAMASTAMPHGSMLGMTSGSMAPMPTDHGAVTGMSHSPAGAMQMAHSGQGHAQGTGTVNSVDAAGRKVNLSHGPLPAIGWPAMTMDFAVAPSVELRAIQPGARVNFTIEKGDGGTYLIQSITPAGGSRR